MQPNTFGGRAPQLRGLLLREKEGKGGNGKGKKGREREGKGWKREGRNGKGT